MTRFRLGLGLTCLSVGVFGCEGEPERLEISSTQAALTAGENASRALEGVVDAADFLAESTSIAGALKALGGQSETCEGSQPVCPDGDDCPPSDVACTSDEPSEADLEETRQEIHDAADDLVRLLRERILIDENLESETSTSATYLLGPDVLCSEDDEPMNAGAAPPEPELDDDCVERVTRLEPRLVLTSPRDGDIDVQLLLGAERHAPLSLSLYRKSLGTRLDLGEALAVARDLGEDLEGVQQLSGLLELRLVENAERDYSLELNVLEALAAVVESEGETTSASLAASSPAWNVRVNGNTNTLSAGIDLGALRLHGPLSAFADMFESDAGDDEDGFGGSQLPGDLPSYDDTSSQVERSYTGAIDLFLAGVSGQVLYTAASDVLSLSDLGFGDSTSTLQHDGNTLLALDLNANSGRRVDLEISPLGDGARVSVTPSFELRLALAFRHVADQFDDIADFLLDDTLVVRLDGAAPALELGEGRVRVAAGTLSLESQANPSANVSVAAGMCLVEVEDGSDDVVDEAAHPLFSIAAGTCE